MLTDTQLDHNLLSWNITGLLAQGLYCSELMCDRSALFHLSQSLPCTPQWSRPSPGALLKAPHWKAKTLCWGVYPARAQTPCSTPGRRRLTASCCPPLLWQVMEPFTSTSAQVKCRFKTHHTFSVSDVFFSLTTDPVAGTVNVRNASATASGTYRCTASNRVGNDVCIMDLNVTPREYPNMCWVLAVYYSLVETVCCQLTS